MIFSRLSDKVLTITKLSGGILHHILDLTTRDAVVSQTHSPSRDSKDLASQNGVLDSVLLPLLDKRCAFFDVPYHGNIGDILIWQGTVDFLARHKQQVVYQASCNRYHFPRFKPDVVILFHGGGNFGTLWRRHQDFKLQVVQHYPDNRIVFLPQSVHYDSEEVLASDVKILAKHRNLFICVRDMESFKIIDSHFHNTVLLLPDMAMAINLPKIKKISVRNKPLFLIRSDKEYVKRNYDAFFSHLNVEPVRSDWPSMENRNRYIDLLSHMSRKKCYPEKLGFSLRISFSSSSPRQDWCGLSYAI